MPTTTHRRSIARIWSIAILAGIGALCTNPPTSRAADGADMQGTTDMQGMSPPQTDTTEKSADKSADSSGGMSAAATPEASTATPPATQPARSALLADEDATPAASRMRQRLTDALAKLDLTADQRTGIKAVLEQARADAQSMRQDLADATPQERMQRMREFAHNVMDKVEGQLTPEQVKTFKAALAGGGPASRPAGLAQGGARPGWRARNGGAAAAEVAGSGENAPGARLQRLAQNLDSLDLNEDQKARVDAMLADARKKAMAIPAGAPDRIAQLQAIRQDIRDKLLDILEPDQLEALRSKMQEQAGAGEGAARRRGAATQPAAMATPAAASPAAASAASADGSADLTAPAKSAPAAGTPIAVGQPVPAFKLESLDGSIVTQASLKGHTTALVFGSYSSPVFRDRAAGLEKLFHQLESQDSSAKLMVVYTKEAHPSGGWQIERNKQDHINIPAAATDADRRAAARTAKTALHLTMPFLVDGMDDATATALGGFPDAAIVVGPDGVVTATQRWAEAGALQRQIREAGQKQATAAITP